MKQTRNALVISKNSETKNKLVVLLQLSGFNVLSTDLSDFDAAVLAHLNFRLAIIDNPISLRGGTSILEQLKSLSVKPILIFVYDSHRGGFQIPEGDLSIDISKSSTEIRQNILHFLFPAAKIAKRVYDRVDVQHSVTWQSSIGQRLESGTITNISVRGASIRAGGTYPTPGEVIEFSLASNTDGDLGLRPLAIVRWVKPADGVRPQPEFGIEFLITDSVFEEQIELLISRSRSTKRT